MLQTDPFRPRDTAHEREYFVATEDGVIVGIINIKEHEIKTFFVASTTQGKGVGTALLAYIEQQIVIHGCTKSTLFSTISAKSFYEKNGYHVVDEKSDKHVNGTINRYFMKKTLPMLGSKN